MDSKFRDMTCDIIDFIYDVTDEVEDIPLTRLRKVAHTSSFTVGASFEKNVYVALIPWHF